MLKEYMEKTKKFFAKKQEKNFGFILRWYNKLERPDWMKECQKKCDCKGNECTARKYDATYSDQIQLFTKGRIALGALVQSNKYIFEKESLLEEDDYAAVIIYSEDGYYEDNPQELVDLASELYSLKYMECENDELLFFAKSISDELSVHFNVLLPYSITGGRNVYYTNQIIHRKHLNKWILESDLFPIIIDPEKTKASVILPSFYWYKKLKNEVEKYKTNNVVFYDTSIVIGLEYIESFLLQISTLIEFGFSKNEISIVLSNLEEVGEDSEEVGRFIVTHQGEKINFVVNASKYSEEYNEVELHFETETKLATKIIEEMNRTGLQFDE